MERRRRTALLLRLDVERSAADGEAKGMIVLRGEREPVNVLQFSPDGRTLVAPCLDGVQVWHNLLPGGSPSTTLYYPYVSLVRFTPDGLKLLLDASPGRLVVHDLATGKAVEVPPEYVKAGGSCDLTPDGRYVVVARTYNGADPPGRLSCRPISSPETTLWSVAASVWIFSRPLFLADGEGLATAYTSEVKVLPGGRCLADGGPGIVSYGPAGEQLWWLKTSYCRFHCDPERQILVGCYWEKKESKGPNRAYVDFVRGL
jgi:hypothetical protein